MLLIQVMDGCHVLLVLLPEERELEALMVEHLLL